MPESNELEDFVVTRGVTEIFLVKAKDAKDAEDSANAGTAMLIQRKTSTNAQPKPETQPTTGAQHPATPK